jgi:short-subunit dehydrogenase
LYNLHKWPGKADELGVHQSLSGKLPFFSFSNQIIHQWVLSPTRTMDFDIKTALITGASSGIGAEFARQLAQGGYSLILIARRIDRLQNLAQDLQNRYKVGVETIISDLSDDDDIQRLSQSIQENYTIDMLVNNAGFGLHGSFVELDSSRHVDMVHVHVLASICLAHAALPGMISRGHGAIINVSSLAGLLPVRNVAYGASKAYLITFSETLQRELRGTGVKIQALCPGFTYTEFHDNRELTGFKRSAIPKPLWSSTDQVVRESLKALQRGKTICVPGLINRFAALLGSTRITTNIFYSVVNRSSRKDKSRER